MPRAARPSARASRTATTARATSATSSGTTETVVPAAPRSSDGWSRDRTSASAIATRSSANRNERTGCRQSSVCASAGTGRKIVRAGAASRMRIVFLTGIWPPDVGGPATHGPDFARFLRDRGHDVRVVTMADHPPTERPVPVTTISRRRPFVVRYPLVASRSARLARRADVLYATATYAAAAAASVAARRPLVAKLVSDPAYERARRYRLFEGTLEAFQDDERRAVRALKALRTASLGRARRIVVPSRYLAEIAKRWAIDGGRIEVLANPAPPPSELPSANAPWRRLRLRRPPHGAEGVADRARRARRGAARAARDRRRRPGARRARAARSGPRGC